MRTITPSDAPHVSPPAPAVQVSDAVSRNQLLSYSVDVKADVGCFRSLRTGHGLDGIPLQLRATYPRFTSRYEVFEYTKLYLGQYDGRLSNRYHPTILVEFDACARLGLLQTNSGFCEHAATGFGFCGHGAATMQRACPVPAIAPRAEDRMLPNQTCAARSRLRCPNDRDRVRTAGFACDENSSAPNAALTDN
jgi:hypothetical protein